MSSHGCGGSTIKCNWILSAAHCLNWTGGEYLIRAGVIDLNQVMSKWGKMISWSNAIIHPQEMCTGNGSGGKGTCGGDSGSGLVQLVRI